MSALRYDPEFYKLAAAGLDKHREVLPVNDVTNRRARVEAFIKGAGQVTLPADIEQVVHHAKADDNHDIAIYHFRKKGVDPQAAGPAVAHIHGGGYTCLSAADSAPILASYVSTTGVPILSIDYRLAPENPFPIPLEDCWAVLLWIYDHAAELGINPSRIAIFGESAGGGLAASLALLARDRKLSPPLAKQILVYPMMDDRTETDHTNGMAVFDVNDVITGWSAYLGDLYKSNKVTPYAAAGRVEDVRGLAPLYLDCGQLDMFIHEGLVHVQKFIAANIPVEFHIYDGVPHAFQRFAPASKVARQAVANRLAAMTGF
ncbi:Alpha/Beta hydrolase protein [Aspergillus unguis]